MKLANVFVTSDTHFGHAGVCKFLNEDGSKLRPWDHPNEMDEAMIQLWNETVTPWDKVYHLGDVVINRKAFPILHRLNGEKVLIKGNHDLFRLEEYLPFFKDIRAYHVLGNKIFSHIPIHPDSKGRFLGNVHGHLHSGFVKDKFGKPDPWYTNVCVEKTGFRPIPLEEVL